MVFFEEIFVVKFFLRTSVIAKSLQNFWLIYACLVLLKSVAIDFFATSDKKCFSQYKNVI